MADYDEQISDDEKVCFNDYILLSNNFVLTITCYICMLL